MKKFFWGFMPYLVVSIMFFVAIGGGESLVPASGESWFFPWTWSMDETRGMIVAGLNGMATITTLAFVSLGVLVASTPMVEAKVEAKVAQAKAKRTDPQQLPPPQADVNAVAAGQGGTFVQSDH